MVSLKVNSDNQLVYSASDLVGFVNCESLTAFDKSVALGKSLAPKVWSPLLELLWERGLKHEKEYIEHLTQKNVSMVIIDGIGINAQAVSDTLEAMKSGVEVIIQAALQDGDWVGRADVLVKVEGESDLGNWLYEPVDTKLAKETKAGSVIQLCLYAAILTTMQGTAPENLAVIPPHNDFKPDIFRYNDYAAYFRYIKSSFENAVKQEVEAPYPEPKLHCDVCRWRETCSKRRRDDDHLSLVANLSKAQQIELKANGINTLTALANAALPLNFEPSKGSIHSLEKAREQARVQLVSRGQEVPIYEVLEHLEGFGLSRLPMPNRGDVFLDFEGDPFVGDGGLEYLTGYVSFENGEWVHTAVWALNRSQERIAFENFVDFIIDRKTQFPDMHIYHYAPYEPAALKRLMGRYASKEEEIDQLLRSETFVDLFSVVRSSIRAGVEGYSIKNLEPVFGYKREKPMHEANLALSKLQGDLELGRSDEVSQSVMSDVKAYNRDDCFSTLFLRDWLEGLRTIAIENGATIERPISDFDGVSEELSERIENANSLIHRLTDNFPHDHEDFTKEQKAIWILAHTLDFHRREAKSLWWEFFRLRDLSVEDLTDERAAITELEFLEVAGGSSKAPIHRYSFVPQETDIRAGDNLMRDGGEKLGGVADLSIESGTIDIKKRMDSRDIHPSAVFTHKVIRTTVLEDALIRLGEYVAANGISGEGEFQAARDLLLRLPPRGIKPPLVQDDEDTLGSARRIVCEMDRGILPIQGPPGAGKTYSGGRIICDLVKQGKTVGITANSHKVIRNMLDGVVEAAEELEVNVQCIQKPKERQDDVDGITFVTDNAQLVLSLGTTGQVGGATAWFWARADVQEKVDVLFVDEAAQMSLANVLAISGAARTLVLLGDPQQLDQPVIGSHPDGTDVSALSHLIGDQETIDDAKGLFLEETWRLHPDITKFTSELFYDGKLESRKNNEHIELTNAGPIKDTGLWILPVEHSGNVNSSSEEAHAVERLISEVLSGGPKWTDRLNDTRDLTLDDILVITPYNAQVYEIQKRLPELRVGTVDKFQGQEAPIAIFSTATSSQEDAPRGMEFLYNLNRLNVATSRAKCACILVVSPALMEAKCRTPQQMQLANAFCRYKELAQEILI